MEQNEPLAATLIGLLGGIVLGLAASRGRFCTLGALEDALYGASTGRLRMWLVALSVAIATTSLATACGVLDPGATLWGRQGFDPLASVVGGGLFGYGMALAGNCGYGALARLGSGDLRSGLVVLVMGIAAYSVYAGPLASLRAALFPPGEAANLGIADALGRALGVAPVVPALAIAAGLLALALASRPFRRDTAAIAWSGAVGAAIALAFTTTAYLHDRSFGGVATETFTFTAPLGETVLFAMTGDLRVGGGDLSFGVGSVAGVTLGAAAGMLGAGRFRWEACDDARELGRQLAGAVLMGTGGVVAVGCSIGQGLGAFSLLAYSAPLTCLAIAAGAALGLRQLIHGLVPRS